MGEDPVDLIDPSLVRTGCGQAVLEIYNDGRDVDCPRCVDGQGDGRSDEPSGKDPG